MSNSVKQIEATIRRNLKEITPSAEILRPVNRRDTRLHRIVASKLNRAKEGTRFLY